MNESPLMIPSVAGISLEGRYAKGRLPGTAILCHPHPLYGGNMDNNVVTLPFDSLRLPASPCLLIAGEKDDFCSVKSLQGWLAKQPLQPDACRLEIMPGADHFYGGHEDLLAAIAKSFLARQVVC